MVLFAALGVLLLLYFIFSSEGKRYQWYESYNVNSDQPYGILFMRKLLESYRPGSDFIFNDKKPLKELLGKDEPRRDTDYIFIGQSVYLNDEDAYALLNFIYEGNDALIASLDPPASIIDRIYTKECIEPVSYTENEAESVTLNFYHATLQTKKGYKYSYRYGSNDESYFWKSLSPRVFCDSAVSITPLGYQEPDLINFFRLPYGKGNLYLHSNPLVFTNYFLTRPEKVNYATGVFSHLKGQHIIWDEYSKIPFLSNNNVYDSPLYYILQQPSLKYAWWLLLVGVILYVSFAAKRTQRVIPVLEKKTNTSLEYVNLISSLHYQNGNHLDMARKKMKYFLYFIRSKYGIHAQNFKEEHIKKLSEKSKVKVAEVQTIFDQYNTIERAFYDVDTKLSDLYYAIENFYRQCK